jgi:methionyl-tRNA formyltransferase
LVAYGKIIPKRIIDIFPHGIINIHPSLLPKYRGPTPIEQAILDGASKTGVSLMQLAPEMDAGPVFTQEEIALKGTESKEELAEQLLQTGAKLLAANIHAILDGSLKPTSQDDSDATYTQLIKKQDGLVEWNKPAEQLEREVRAYLGWPKSRAEIFGHETIVTKARVAKDHEDGGLVIQCKPGWLEIQELTAPSGRTISGTEFLRGYAKS